MPVHYFVWQQPLSHLHLVETYPLTKTRTEAFQRDLSWSTEELLKDQVKDILLATMVSDIFGGAQHIDARTSRRVGGCHGRRRSMWPSSAVVTDMDFKVIGTAT